MDLYREEILEHWQNPQNYGEIKDADLRVELANPLCGDEIKLQIKLNSKKTNVSDIKFTCNGCAISTASASILSEFIKGKSIRDLDKLTGKNVLNLLGGKVAPARLKCAFLPLEALRKLVAMDEGVKSK